MASLPPINEDMSYSSESSYEEQECKHCHAAKVALLATTMFCAIGNKIKNPGESLAEGVND